MVNYKLCKKCCKRCFTKVLHFQRWKTTRLLNQILLIRNLHGNAKKSLCCNPSLRIATKARACESASQVWSPRITFHGFISVGKCEGMNPHTPKWAPILGVGVPMDSQIFIEKLQGSKTIWSKSSLYHWKTIRM